MTAGEFRPWTVGQPGVCVVGVEGIVQAIGTDTVTINGTTLPTRLDQERGVRSVSMVWPDAREPGPEVEVGYECDHADDDLIGQHLEDLIKVEHIRAHDGPWAWCSHALCQATREVTE